MCRAKPGRRCPVCQTRLLNTKIDHLRRTTAHLGQAQPGSSAHTRLQEQQADLARQVAMRRADVASTRQFQAEGSARLRELLSSNPKDPEVGTLTNQLLEGRILEAHRRKQEALMPASPTQPAALRAYQDLGAARFDMAHCQLRMDRNGTNRKQWQYWNEQHYDAAQRANIAEARMQAIERSGRGDGWTRMTADQQAALRRELADRGGFDTQVAPRSITDVVDDIVDNEEGIAVVPHDVDDYAVPPLAAKGGTSPNLRKRPATNARLDSGQQPAPTEQAAPARQQKQADADGHSAPPGLQQRERVSQARRRSRRRSSVRAEWRRTMAQARRLDNKTQALDTAVDSTVGKDTKDEGAVFDLTLLSFIIEQLPGGKR